MFYKDNRRDTKVFLQCFKDTKYPFKYETAGAGKDHYPLNYMHTITQFSVDPVDHIAGIGYWSAVRYGAPLAQGA